MLVAMIVGADTTRLPPPVVLQSPPLANGIIPGLLVVPASWELSDSLRIRILTGTDQDSWFVRSDDECNIRVPERRRAVILRPGGESSADTVISICFSGNSSDAPLGLALTQFLRPTAKTSVITPTILRAPSRNSLWDHPITGAIIGSGIAVIIACLGVFQTLRSQRLDRKHQKEMEQVHIAEVIFSKIDVEVATNIERLRRFLGASDATPPLLVEAPFHLVRRPDVRDYLTAVRGTDYVTRLTSVYGDDYLSFHRAAISLDGFSGDERANLLRSARNQAQKLLDQFRDLGEYR
jgi:hypothetical protein